MGLKHLGSATVDATDLVKTAGTEAMFGKQHNLVAI